MRFPSVAVFVAMASATIFAACSGGTKPCADLFCETPETGTGVDADVADVNPFPDSGTTQPTFSATCAQTTISVAMNTTSPTVSCTASDKVTWNVDRGEIGTMDNAGPSASATFTPTGTTGGVVTVLASIGKSTVGVPILVKLTGQSTGNCPPSQNATSTTQLTTGGGVGGVGGEGCGASVTDQATLNALANPSGTGGLTWLYPYDKTVFPRGVLAPLLQWSWATNDADALQIKLSTMSGSFSWTGTFSRPAILGQTNGTFIRHPIPEDVWEMATNTAGTKINNVRDDLTVAITIAKGGQGYGPISETWTIAPGSVKGTLYYGAYGTNYTSQFSCAGNMGAGTLAIKHGATSPISVTSTTQCTQCHVVSANGSTLITDHDPCPGNGQDYDWIYDLKSPSSPANLPQVDGVFTWGAISPKGNLFFSDSAPATPPQLLEGDLEGASTTPSGLYALPAGTSVVTPAQIQSQLGLTSQLGGSLPVFSPDGKHIAFNFYKGGPGVDNKSGDGRSIAVVDFDGVSKFSNLRTVYTPPANSNCPTCAAVWMSFTPTNDALVFELEKTHATNATFGATGGRAELWWVDLATKTPHRLDMANGVGYLPSGPSSHDDDTTLQYEPSVLPISSGGYVWIVFTSRRLYGSVATIDPWTSPSESNTKPLLKKLWVSAFDLNAPAGTDASHPSFYLPAQDLLTVNARAYWVLDPCKGDGTSCGTGDECCGGHCVAGGDGGALVCGKANTCGGEGDTCASASDCCSGLQCVGGPDNGHCDVIPVK